jgi:hypothetical protein
VKDGTMYGELIEQIGPVGMGQRILKETNPANRATAIIAAVDQLTPFCLIADPKRILCCGPQLP